MNPNQDMSILSLILHASIPVQLVMAILVVISVISWTYIFSKRTTIKRTQRQTEKFEADFWSGGDLTMLHHAVATHRVEHGALARIFESGMSEFLKGRKSQPDASAVLEGANRAMRASYQRELDTLDRHLAFLASAGSVSPYIGLFGTVWGIMHAFVGLAGMEQVTLAVVAPGIAEALIATAIGLFAAIPAVVAYNRYSHEVDRLATRFDSFIDEFLNILQRQVR
ncbi:protein TolQ [Verticiella sediminum]|uniref:Tol-Pal system protein TolQ n=1 Tax=Verticiella sediminum TaxID=1247510 RepID=A0A556B270_9BURK|nr:protein TolQ [Verticiella sediminum]TSH98865.1 protein TolQ [Verticiella sediminum]